MAAVRFHGSLVHGGRLPLGHSADGGGTRSGPQHALHSVRWPCWDPARPAGPGLHLAGGGVAAPAAPRAGKPALPGSGEGSPGHLAGRARHFLPLLKEA